MWRIARFGTVCGLVFLLLIGGAAVSIPASAKATPMTFPLKDATLVFEAPDFCTGVVGTITHVVNGVMLFTVDARGGLHFQFTGTGDITFVPLVPGTPSYTGHAVQWFGSNVMFAQGGAAQGTFTVSAQLTGSDGSTLRFNVVFTMTFAPDGKVTASFGRVVCH